MRSAYKQKNPTISNVKSLDLWSSRAGQIQTFFLRRISGQSVLKTDGLGATLVVERNQHPVIVQKNGIDKNLDQRFSLLFLRNIELSKFHQPESDEILIEAGLLQFFICDLQSTHLSGFPALPDALSLSGCTSRPLSPSSGCPAFC